MKGDVERGDGLVVWGVRSETQVVSARPIKRVDADVRNIEDVLSIARSWYFGDGLVFLRKLCR